MPNGEAEDVLNPPAGLLSRLFVGIKVAPEIGHRLAQFASGLESPFVRPVAPADIHLTLVPPWNKSCVPGAIARLNRVAGGFSAFWLDFRHVGYGPQARRPHLLWVDCTVGDEGAALRAALLDAFGQIDERPFQPHVTLARIRAGGHAICKKYPIDQPLSLRQRVASIELFQSPPSGERGYVVLASTKLQDVSC